MTTIIGDQQHFRPNRK